MFQCDSCGLCCKKLDKSTIYNELNRGDGICKFFDENTNLCSIYYNRPILCRVDDMYEKYYHKVMTRDEYYNLNYDACEKIKERGNM